MIILYTIGFTKKSLEKFIGLLNKNKITKLIDIRLNRKSQLAGFAKEKDLKFVIENLLNMKYGVIEDFAPTKGLLREYQKTRNWDKYEQEFKKLIRSRKLERYKEKILTEKDRICFLCSESEPDKCHRRLISEFFKSLNKQVVIKHL